MKIPMTLLALLTLGAAMACGPAPESPDGQETQLETSTSAVTHVGIEPDEIDNDPAPRTPDEVASPGRAGEAGKPNPPPPPPPRVMPIESISLNSQRTEDERPVDESTDVTSGDETGAPREDGSQGEAAAAGDVTYGPVLKVKPKG
jgi:hypothetical protein